MRIKELLRSLGLSTYEAEVYDALVRVGRAKVQDLANVVTVPRPQIYVALGKLMNKGMCSETRGKVSYYSAVAPDVAFQDVLRKQEQALQARTEGLKKLAEVFVRPEKEDVPYDFVQVLKGRQIKKVISELTQGAKEEILVFFKQAEEKSDEELDVAAREETAVLKKGVRVRCLYEQKVLESPKVVALLRRLVKKGEQGRVVSSLPMNMLMADDCAATFSLIRTKDDVTVFVFNHPALVATMRASFEYFWRKGRDLAKVLKKKEKEER